MQPSLKKLSVVIPARNEEDCIETTVRSLYSVLNARNVPHEIVVVDDGSTDRTWEYLQKLSREIPALRPVQNQERHGFGRAVIYGIDSMSGDAAVIFMADESDDCGDVVRYWDLLNEGYDAVLGSRFVCGGGVVDYPWFKYCLNRMVNFGIRVLFGLKFNDITNAFKAYRKTALDGCRPFFSRHFNLTVELPLKVIIRGYSWVSMPIRWRNRTKGLAKFKIKELGSRYTFSILCIWLEWVLCGIDYRPEKKN